MSVHLSVEDSALRVRLGGIDRLLAMKAGLDVPAERVRSVSAVERRRVPYIRKTWLRLPGTHLPGLVRHGSYGRPPTRDFWAVFRSPVVVVVEIEDWDYARLVLRCEDPQSTAVRLAAEVARARRS
jgi:hypothetical protein